MSAKKYFREIFEKNQTQDPVIDAVRAFSVLSIIAFHVTIGIIQIYSHEKAKEYIFNMPSFLQPLWHGEKGVDAFFLISALVLGMPFFKKMTSFDFSAALNFYKKRFFRIYPLFFFALLLYTAGQWSYFGKYFLSNLLLINNLIPGERTIIPVGWSLLVEVQYYALLPALFFILKQADRKAAWLCGLFFFSVLSCAGILWLNPDLYMRPLTDIFLAEDRITFASRLGDLFYEANLSRFGPFVAGLWLAYVRIFHSERLAAVFKRKWFSGVTLLFAAIFFWFGVGLPLYNPGSWYYTQFSPIKNFLTLISIRQIFSVSLILFMLGCWYGQGPFKIFRKILELRLWTPISRLSFPIYLFHFPFIAVAAVLIFGTTDVKTVIHVEFYQAFGVFLLATILTVLFSIPLYIYIERPFIERAKKRS